MPPRPASTRPPSHKDIEKIHLIVRPATAAELETGQDSDFLYDEYDPRIIMGPGLGKPREPEYGWDNTLE